MPNLIRRIAAVVMSCAFAGAAYGADLKITTRNTMAGNSSEGTTYIKGMRQRTEMQMGPMQQVTITQCDRRQILTLSDACRTYMVAPMDDDSTGTAPRSSNNAASNNAQRDTGPPRQGGTLTLNTSSAATGETQKMFGYTARRIRSTMTMNSSPDACNPANMKMESDGWYADFSGGGLSCSATPRPGGGNMGRVRPDCQDRVRYTGGGMRNLGYPMKLTTTMTDAQGNTYTSTQETTELSRATLDPALFDVPAGYRQVDSYQGLMCQEAMSGMGSASRPPPSRQDDQMQGHRRGGRGPLCVAPVLNQTSTSVDNETWRDTLITELQRVRVESVKLDAQNQFDLRAEAAAKGCHYVLYTDVTELQQPSGARRRARAAGAGAGANPANNYRSSLHVQLQPTDDFMPRLDVTTNGTGSNLDTAGEGALRSEAQQVATELSKPR
ncbi:MAG: DUF4412 domain-containing protein [Acidobacteriota bacterium]|nr:DUF4412 domain-containing protein [Acidobacteriota bacterium]